MTTTEHMARDTLFAGPGEARRLARSVDWGATPLGPVEGWAAALRTTARVCMASQTPIALWAGPEYTLVHNDAYSAVLGGKRGWAMGRPGREVWAEVWDTVGPEFDLVARSRVSTRHEDAPYVLRRHGRDEKAFFTFTLAPLEDDDGRVVAVFNPCEETTPAVRARASSEEKYRSLLDSIDEGFCIVEVLFEGERAVDYRVLEANPAFASHTGLRDAAGKTIRELVPTHEAHWFAAYGRVALTGEPTRFELPAAGLGRDLDVFAFRVGPAEQRHVALLLSDVTERRRAEAALRESEAGARLRAAELETVLDTVPAAVWISRDPRGDRIDANRFAAALLRHGPGEYVSLTAPGADRPRNFGMQRAGRPVPPDELPIQRAARRGEEIRDAEVDLVFDDGQVRHLLGNAAPVREPDGRVTGSVGAFIDITARREAEEQLAAVMEQLPVAVGVLDMEGRVFLGNSELEKFGLARGPPSRVPEERERWTARDEHGQLLPPDRWPAARALRGEVVSPGLQCLYRTRDGREVHAVVSAVPLRKASGEQTGVIVVLQDVTRLKEVEEELRRSDRQKADFLAVLSHELRNPLAPIRSSLYLLEHAKQPEQATRALEVLSRQSEHLTRLVDDLLDVTRISRGKVALQRSRLDLREVAWKTTDDLRSTFEARGVALRVERVAGPAWVYGDAVRLAQVLSNLLQNAVKFTPSGGTVTVEVASAGDQVTLSVRDTGEGMEPGEVERMFEPFEQAAQGMARTRGGLGLGLALVKGFVELHGGTVRAASAGRGKGAEFVVTLPLTDELAPPGDAPPEEPSSAAPDRAPR